jgi:hypothetical protein
LKNKGLKYVKNVLNIVIDEKLTSEKTIITFVTKWDLNKKIFVSQNGISSWKKNSLFRTKNSWFVRKARISPLKQNSLFRTKNSWFVRKARISPLKQNSLFWTKNWGFIKI